MEGEKVKYELRHGGPELHLEDEQVQALFDSYKEQFGRQQAETGLTDEAIRGYLQNVLSQPKTVILFSEDKVMGMGGIHYFSENSKYPKNAIVELNTFVVTKEFRGKGVSEEILDSLQKEAFAACPQDRGIIFTLITANPIVEHQAVKKGYREKPVTDWLQMTGVTPREEGYFEKFGYKTFVNEEYLYRDPSRVNQVREVVKKRVLALLARFSR
jgi:GNAT superfamily N-acetyltransferase